MEYTHNELKVLWHLKRAGGTIQAESASPKDSVVTRIAEAIELRRNTVGAILKHLETKCILIRTFKRGGSRAFADSHGFDPIVKVELIDPQMYLPPLPAPMPLAAVMSHENDELYERTNCEPTDETIILALLTENEKLRFQIDKLQEVVNTLAKENERLTHEVENKQRRPRRDEQVTTRIKDALPPEEWDRIHHTGRQ